MKGSSNGDLMNQILFVGMIAIFLFVLVPKLKVLIFGSDDPLPNGVIIDVRTKGEWDYDHIDGAILIPDYSIGSMITSKVPDKTTPINLYCASGMRASSAKSKLKSMGYTNVSNIGGISSARTKLLKQKRTL